MLTNAPIAKPMSVIVFDGTNRKPASISPSDYIKSGGVGDVYRFKRPGQSNQCVKIYKAQSLEIKSKLLAMLQRPPRQVSVEINGKHYVQFTWPTALVEDAQGFCIGFVMPEVDFQATESLQPYLVPKAAARKLSAEARSLNNRLTLARNIAALMADLHAQGHAFVDFKDQNLRVYPDLAMAAFIDTDGYRIEHADGRVHPGLVTTATFNSPESARGERAALSKDHDNFVLALVLFQLLNFGIHPFQGVPSSSNKSGVFDLDDNIIKQAYPYGARKHAQLLPSPASIHECWPAKTLAFFEQTFLNMDATKRVSAADWVQHLNELSSKEMVKCAAHPANIEHVHFNGRACHMCYAATTIKYPPPPPLIPGGGGVKTGGGSGPGLPPPPKARSKGVLGWILAIIAIGMAAVYFNLPNFKQDTGSYTPQPELAPAPAPAPVAAQKQTPTDVAAQDSKNVGSATQFTDLLGSLNQFGDEQTSELQRFADAATTAKTSNEFLRKVNGVFKKSSGIWEWEKTAYAKNNTQDPSKASLLDKAAADSFRSEGATPRVRYTQTQAVALAPTDPVLVTNLAKYLLSTNPVDAQSLAILAMHLEATKNDNFSIYTLEVLASALLKTQEGRTGPAQSVLMSTVLLSSELDRRCAQMKRYATLYPGLEAVTALPMATARDFLIANGKSGDICTQ